jgi:hypothetical protein
MGGFILCCSFALFVGVHAMNVDADRVGQQDAMALGILALIGDSRSLDEDKAYNSRFTSNDIIPHLRGLAGLADADIDTVRNALNDSIPRLHIAGRVPQYFIPTNGNAEDIEQYLIH